MGGTISKIQPDALVHGLSDLRISALIDFVTLEVPGHVELHGLLGNVKWAKSKQYKRVSVHDLDPRDVGTLVSAFPDHKLLEVEVSVDIRPRKMLPPEKMRVFSESIHQRIARSLYPDNAPLLEVEEAKSFNPFTRKVIGFQARVPKVYEQLLYAWRADYVQVKVYNKITNNKIDLAPRYQSVRAEVALRDYALEHFGLTRVENLVGFNFRKNLSEYFTMIKGARATQKRSERPLLKMINEHLQGYQKRELAAGFSRVGVQATIGTARAVYLRDVEFNQRIGKALGRLTADFRRPLAGN